jgi:hypothetical protein
VSFSVQLTPSLQDVALFVMTHPFAFAEGLPGLQTSVVQPLLSLHRALLGLPTQVPPEQVSGSVQNSPSSHGFELFANTHPAALALPLAGLQVSVVQTLPSLHRALLGVPEQVPPPHTSFVVQERLSLQATVLFVNRQPVVPLAPGAAGLHVSVVQRLPSLQFVFTGVLTQLPLTQASVVHERLSVHTPPGSAGKVQPPDEHTLFVQGLPSLQFESRSV